MMPVPGTNNEAERALRGSAEARKTCRTSKTVVGARRQTVLVSVLESLRRHLSTYTLSSVIEEIDRWYREGLSCFSKQVLKLGLSVPSKSILDSLLPKPAD